MANKGFLSGFGYQKNPGRNLLGLGLNWGEPNEDNGPGLDDQYTTEIFFRWQASKATAVTPSVEYIKNPALDQDADSIWVIGVRARLAL